MPLDDGCRLDQHHGVEDLRPEPVKPRPQQPVGGEKPRAARVLPAQDGQLLSQGDEFELQGEAATNAEQEQRTEGGQKPEHAGDGMTASPKTPCVLGFLEF